MAFFCVYFKELNCYHAWFMVPRLGGYHERKTKHLQLLQSVHPEVYPPSAAPEATRVSKGERVEVNGDAGSRPRRTPGCTTSHKNS